MKPKIDSQSANKGTCERNVRSHAQLKKGKKRTKVNSCAEQANSSKSYKLPRKLHLITKN
jgi:hypothetical protein